MSAAVPVAALLGARGAGAELDFDLLAGAAGLERGISLAYIQKTGLALAGYDAYLRPGRVLIFGESEIRFLEQMEAAARRTAIARVLSHDLPCVVLTLGLEPPPELVAEYHIAGHSVVAAAGETLLVDTHDAPVAAAVWQLFAAALLRIGRRPVLLERDARLPPLAALIAEARLADRLMEAGRARVA